MLRTFLVLHVLGAVVALGFSLSYGIWTARADAAGVVERVFALRTISWIDRRMTTPAFIWQAITGTILLSLLDWNWLKQSWLEISIGLYVLLTVLAITRFAPLHRRQTAIAEQVVAGAATEADYRVVADQALRWGVVVTLLTAAILVLMITKPIWW